MVIVSNPRPRSPHLERSPGLGTFQGRRLREPRLPPDCPGVLERGLLSLGPPIPPRLGSAASNANPKGGPRAFSCHPVRDPRSHHTGHRRRRENTLNRVQRPVTGKPHSGGRLGLLPPTVRPAGSPTELGVPSLRDGGSCFHHVALWGPVSVLGPRPPNRTEMTRPRTLPPAARSVRTSEAALRAWESPQETGWWPFLLRARSETRRAAQTLSPAYTATPAVGMRASPGLALPRGVPVCVPSAAGAQRGISLSPRSRTLVIPPRKGRNLRFQDVA